MKATHHGYFQNPLLPEPLIKMTETLLFVYGTLRRQSSHPMARYLEAHSTYLGRAKVAGKLFDLGRYPGLVEADGPEQTVFGDLVEVHDPRVLDKLDRYENGGIGKGQAYERQLVEVTWSSKPRKGLAWVYWYRGALEGCGQIETGDYFNRETNT